MAYSDKADIEPDSVLPTLDTDLTLADQSISAIGAALKAADHKLVEHFRAGASIGDLVRLRAAAVDRVLLHLWHNGADTNNNVALVAVGGYGRGELHPCSDVDIMVLCSHDLSDEAGHRVSVFVTSLWDVGLDIGHSVRTVPECHSEAEKDLTVATTLMESRLLSGQRHCTTQ